MQGFFPISYSFLGSVLLTIATSGPGVIHAGEDLDWARITERPPAELSNNAKDASSALIELRLFDIPESGSFTSFRGFFIRADGLAICPAFPLCGRDVPEFYLGSDGLIKLETPVVWKILEDLGLALVKFEHECASPLELSDGTTPMGTWVAVVTTPGTTPLVGPILSLREAGFEWGWLKEKPEVIAKQFSVLAPERWDESKACQIGSPLIDESKKVVAAFQGILTLEQTLRFATPVSKIREFLDEDQEDRKPLTLPVPEADNPFHPARLDPLYDLAVGADLAENFADAHEYYQALEAKFPGDKQVQKLGMSILRSEFSSGLESLDRDTATEKMIEFAKSDEIAEDAFPWEKAEYHLRLGIALQVAERDQEAIEEFKRAVDLHPACGAFHNLAQCYERLGNTEEAVQYWKRAVALEPERIGMAKALRTALIRQRSFDEEVEISRRCRLLERIYKKY